MDAQFDLLIIGGGINGVGIAHDAAGRGLRVLLCEKDDLAQHTSSASSKLIHGGLRYLEYYEFRLVAEALAEREVLLRLAPHIIRPLTFVMPYVPQLRPAWMIRAGLFLYDHLGRRRSLPGSRAVRLDRSAYGANLKPEFVRGFIYSDCRVDDARLVVLNAMAARDLGAQIRTRTACVSAKRGPRYWEVSLRAATGECERVTARAIVNAAGPWVREVLVRELAQPPRANVKHIKGSHIIVPRCYPGEHAFILQNDDRRVVFMIPYEERFTLIGTTDIEVDDGIRTPSITDAETVYLCAAASRYLARAVRPEEVVWSYSGVRPLYDDGQRDPSAITRDYTLVYDDVGAAPLLSIFGGKITTYRRLAENVLSQLSHAFPGLLGPWTAGATLPGGAIARGDMAAFEQQELARLYPWLPPEMRHALARRHGSNVAQLLRGASRLEDLGQHFGDTLYAAEVDYFLHQEWASTADDILWRRTKCGLHMSAAAQRAVESYLAERKVGV